MLRRLASVLAVVAAVSVAAAGDARANAPFLFDPCRMVAAHSTQTLGPGVPFVDSVSWYGTYGTGLCPRYVLDVHVPTSSSGGPGFLDGFVVGGGPLEGGQLGLTNQLQCDDYVGHLRVYRKSALGGEFGLVGGGRLHGHWVANDCVAVKEPGFVDLPAFAPPSLAPVVYRIVVGATWLGGYRTVQLGAWHLPAF